MAELKDFQKLVIENASKTKGLEVGDTAPDFNLPNALGENISLYKSLKSGKVILKFYRGEWCPICNLDLRELQNALYKIKSLGASLIAISPQKTDNALTITQKNNLEFEVLSDSNQNVIKAYKLQFDPGENYHNRRDLTKENGDASKTLPVPATFIINQDGVIISRHFDINYTERMSTLDIIEVIKS